MHRHLISATAALLLALATPTLAEEVVLHDQWFAQFQRDKKAGWAHERRVRTERGGATVVITETAAEITRGPDGNELEKPIVSSSRFVETEDGAVLAYATSVDIGLGAQTRAGTVEDGVVAAVEDGKARTVPYPAGALGPAAVERALIATLKPNGKGSVLAFEPLDPGKGETVKWKVPSQTTLVDVLGVHAWLFAVEKTDSTGIPEIVYQDAGGGSYGGAFNFGLIRSFRTEELVAKADVDPASWMTSRVVAPDRVIPAAALRDRTLLRLTRAEGDVGALPESKYQRVVKRGADGSVDVELLGGEPKGDLVVWMRPYNGDDQDEGYLAGSRLIEVAHPRMESYSASFVGDLQDGLSCARVLELRVHQSVRPAPANVGFATAAQTISAGTGDSTESAVLTVGLARALGLPARLVAGFVYWGPDQWPGDAHPRGGFAFHVWAEIYAGEDLWHPVDPMRMDASGKVGSVADLRGRGGFDATHVAVLRSDGATDQPFTDIALPVLQFMDGLKIEVLEPKE